MDSQRSKPGARNLRARKRRRRAGNDGVRRPGAKPGIGRGRQRGAPSTKKMRGRTARRRSVDPKAAIRRRAFAGRNFAIGGTGRCAESSPAPDVDLRKAALGCRKRIERKSQGGVREIEQERERSDNSRRMKMVEPSKFEKIWESRPRRRWSCPDEETISAYIDRTLDDNRSKPVVSHLVDCTYCRELVATTVKLQSVEDLPEVPAGLMRRALAAGETQSRRWVWRWAPASSAAAALVCAVLIVAVWRAPQELVIHKRPAPTAPAITKFEGPKTGEAPQNGRERKPSSHETEPTMITPQQGQLVSRNHLKFRWNAVP